MDKALEAARPPRELLWNEYCDEQGQPDRWDAETPFNTYYGIALLHDGYSVQHDYADVAKALQSLDEAKAAAVSDCSQRCTIYLAALPATDTSGLVEDMRGKASPTYPTEKELRAADRIEALERENAGLEEACDETLAVAVRNKDRAEKAEARADRLAAENERLLLERDRQITYACDLQRIVEDLCASRPIRVPESAARHHYDMAVAARAALSGGKDGE